MSGHKLAVLLGALIFLIVAGLSLYRLMFGFPITIGTLEVGQTISFFVFVTCAALSVMLFASVKSEDRR